VCRARFPALDTCAGDSSSTLLRVQERASRLPSWGPQRSCLAQRGRRAVEDGRGVRAESGRACQPIVTSTFLPPIAPHLHPVILKPSQSIAAGQRPCPLACCFSHGGPWWMRFEQPSLLRFSYAPTICSLLHAGAPCRTPRNEVQEPCPAVACSQYEEGRSAPFFIERAPRLVVDGTAIQVP